MTVKEPLVRLYERDSFGLPNDEVLYGWSVKAISAINAFAALEVPMLYSGYADLHKFSSKKYNADSIVTARVAGCYEQPTFKSRLLFDLYMGSYLETSGKVADGFCEIVGCDGERFWMHAGHLGKIKRQFDENTIVSTAKAFLGSPYKWAGKTVCGIDCSGLVAMCYFMCGLEIYRDSDPDKTPSFVRVNAPYEIGDVLFLKGHVGIYVGNDRVVHSSWTNGKVTYCKTDEFKALGEFVCCCRHKDKNTQPIA